MVKKIMTGLAISVGAGIALTFTTRAAAARKEPRTGWHPAQTDGELLPVTVRVHTAVPRNGQARMQPEVCTSLTTMSPERSAELAEIRVMIEALEARTGGLMNSVNQRIDDLQSHLPRFIDVKVASRIREVEERLRTDFQDEQSRTLDAFLQTLEQKVLPRIMLVEEAVGAQGEEIGKMRQRIEKTDETLDRVLDRIEKVVDSMTPPLPAYVNSHVTEINQKAVA